MKKIIGLILSICLLASLFMASPVYAATSGTCGDNLTWVISDDGVLTISGTGAMYSYASGAAPWYSLKDQIKKIHLEEGVETISQFAFSDFDAVTEITFPESLITIDNKAFYDCDALIQAIIPSKVTTIGEYAFSGCGALTTVSIPGNKFIVGLNAFSDCTNLKNLTLDEGLYGIGNGTFYNCSSLESVTLPESLKRLGSSTFSYTGLKKVVIPDNVTTVSTAFANCDKLTEIHFGKSVTAIPIKVTLNSNNVTTFTVSAENESYSAVDGVLFSKDMTTLILYPAGKEGPYAVPQSVTTLGEHSFLNATSIHRLALYTTLKKIGSYAFSSATLFTIDYYGSREQWAQIEQASPVRNMPTIYHVIDEKDRFCGENLIWEFNTETGTLTISGTGPMYDYSNDDWENNPPWTAFVYPTFFNSKSIKKIIIEDGVTSIGAYAFYDCAEELTDVYIPDSVTHIGEYAFCSADKLANVRFPETPFTIGSYAFALCNSLTYIPENVSTISRNAFYYCQGLKDITIPETCVKIELSAFESCKNLESVTVGSNVTEIGESAFYNCTSLETVDTGNGVTKLGKNIFTGCTNLKTVNIGSSVAQIGQEAFYGCTALKNILVSDNNTVYSSIDGNLYSKNKDILYAYAFGKDDKSFVVPDTVTTIADYAIYGGVLAKIPFDSITVPASVTKIGKYATYANVNSAYWPYLDVYYLGTEQQWNEIDKGFAGMDDRFCAVHFIKTEILKEGTCGENLSWFISSENSLEISGSGAMYNYTTDSPAPWSEYASSITRITIPKTVTSIGDYAFDGFSSLNKIYYGSNSRSWNNLVIGSNNLALTSATLIYGEDEVPYGMCGDNLEWVIENNTLTISGTGAMYDYDGDTPWYFEGAEKLVIEDGVTYIGSSAFAEMGITSVSFPDSVKEIGKYAFSTCSGLQNINFNKVEKIGNYAFSSCSDPLGYEGLTNITIGDCVTEIGEGAFKDCASLNTVHIGKSVTTIGDDAFTFTNISSFEVDAENKNYSAYNDVLFNKDRTVLIKYPEWRDTEGYVIPDTVKEIADYAFSDSEYLMSLTIPSSVKKIGYAAFTGSYWFAEVYYYGTKAQWDAIDIDSSNTELENVNIKFIEPVNDVTYTIENGVLTLSGTGKMTDYTSPNPAPWSSFSESITKVVVEEGITYLSNFAFANLPYLTEVTLPSTLTTMGKYTFAACKNLTTVNMYGATTQIGSYAFYKCDNLKNINIDGDIDDYKALNINKDGNLLFERANITYTSENGKVYASMSIYARWAYDTETKTLLITNYPHVAAKDMLNYKTMDDVPWSAYISEIETVEINGVSSLGSRSLMGASNLKNVVIDNALKKIHSWAFYKCTSLESLKIGSGITAVGTGAFNGATSLKSAEINKTLEEYSNMKFNTSNNPIIRATTTLSDGITGYQGGKIYWNLKDGVLTLTGTGNMPSISSPEKAPWHAYKDTITKVVVKQGVTSVSTNAFAGLTNLETAEIGEGVTAIGTYAFKATKIKTVSLPSTLKTVGTSAFSNCPYVTNVIYNGTSDAFAKVTVNGGNSRFNSATKKFN